MTRADKLIADNTTLSRREAALLIRARRVTADGKAVLRPEQKLPEETILEVDGKPVRVRKFIYIMMNKPSGIVSVSSSNTDVPAVSLLTGELQQRGPFPAGRLDRDTTGFLLLTDDGAFAHDILSPKKHIPKVYEVTLDCPVTSEMQAGFKAGVTLADGSVCKTAGLVPDPSDPLRCTVTLTQGMYHQIKRMFGVYGAGVEKLHRSRMGGLALDASLSPGEYRELTEDELRLLSSERI